ncbi:MAG: hypothetical protein JAZ11_00160 [Candidatus Thiodiazotropha lotti]|nr:hypothetical protein [Candidatus Thiodiazotropha lotti]
MKRRKKKQAEYAFISIKVDVYSVRSEAGINYHLHSSLYPFDHEDEPIYSFETVLHISGVCTDPKDRAGHRFDITLYGMPDVQRNNPRIKDLHERDEHGSHKYRKRRGREEPVYAPAPPIAYIDKIRGDDRWTTSVFVAPQMVTDSLIILSGPKPAYISIHEIKESRKRRVNSLSVQTTDPKEE